MTSTNALLLFLGVVTFASSLVSTELLDADLELQSLDRTSAKKKPVLLTEEEAVEPIRGVYLEETSRELAAHLRRVSNEELGVTALQSVYDGLPFGPPDRDDAARVRDMVERLQAKLGLYVGLVNRSRAAVEELYWTHLHRPLGPAPACRDVPESLTRYDSHFGTAVSEELACDSTPAPAPFGPGRNLTDVLAANRKAAPAIKWQYFLGADGGLGEYPAHRADAAAAGGLVDADVERRRDLFVQAVYPRPKQVVLVVDHGSALSPNQLRIAKAIGKYVVSTLSPEDRVGVLALADEVTYADVECAGRGPLAPASAETKRRLGRFIDGLTKAKAPADHVLGFSRALDVARRAMLVPPLARQDSRAFESTAEPVPAGVSGCASGGSDAAACPHSHEDCPMETKDQVLLLYVSRGLLSSIAEPRQVMELVGLGQMCLHGQLVISTYALIDDGKPIMYEKTFLQDVALQNYRRYNVSFAALDKLPIGAGQALAVNSTRGLAATLTGYASVLLHPAESPAEAAHLSPAHWDPLGRGMVVSLTQPCYHLDQLIGAVGVDLHLADLVEDVVYFQQPGGRSHALLVDVRSGATLMHPALVRPLTVRDGPPAAAVDVGVLLGADADLRRQLLSLPAGSAEWRTSTSSASASGLLRRITWQRLADGLPLVVAVVTIDKPSQARQLRRVPVPAAPDLVYHRLDVVSSPAKVELCRLFRQVSTLDAGSLYLSPAAFQSSFAYAAWPRLQTPSAIESFMTFLNDRTKLIANPGLRATVRSDVSALTQLVAYWKAQLGHSPLGQFLVRRYAAVPGGALAQYPAGAHHPAVDPVRQSWYRRAVEFAGRVVVTGPTLDPAGSGYVVSVSHTVYEGRAAALHGAADDVVAVLGADFTLAYFHRLLWETLPFCPERSREVLGSNIRCFLMDERGYLLVHPNLLDLDLAAASGGGSAAGVEQQHLTHHEPLVASDLLNHDSFVVKKACRSPADGTVQRFYQLNLTLTAGLAEGGAGGGGVGPAPEPVPVLTNLVHGEHCIRYQIVAVKGTNLFVGVVNQTCDTATAFCPCSTVDRLCLNCHRMEQSECECPCECPLEAQDTCPSPASVESTLPICTAPAETEEAPLPPPPPPPPPTTAKPPTARAAVAAPVDAASLAPCLASDCHERLTERECFGVVGCEWCLRESETHAPLREPFCTRHAQCYGGVLRGVSPYADEASGAGGGAASESDAGAGSDFDADSGSLRGLPVGPVAGGVMAFFFLVAVSVYCYRQHGRRRGGASALYDAAGVMVGGGGAAGAGLRMSHFDHDLDDHDMEPDADETTAVVAHEFSVANGNGLDNVAVVSPYRVNTSYRRPAYGDSDHGYSTMTPNNDADSEHTASYIEPLLLVGRQRPSALRSSAAAAGASGGSFSSRCSSPMAPVSSARALAAARASAAAESTLHESADELADSTERPTLAPSATDATDPKRRLNFTCEGTTDLSGLDASVTVLPDDSGRIGHHQLIVPVTVHMVDTN